MASAGAPDGLVVVLNTARLRHGTSALAGIAIGLGLVLKTNTLGQWTGYVAMLWGLYHAAWWLFTTVRGSATLSVTPAHTNLPRNAFKGMTATLPTDQITAAYLLRHASPWNKAAPTLVIEAGNEAFIYPRDWFKGEADQRRVIDTLASGGHRS